MVGISVSYWDGLFSGAMLVSGSVHHSLKPRSMKTTVDGWNPANQLRLVVYPIIYGVLDIPGGCLGFQPSTVCRHAICPKTPRLWIFIHQSRCFCQRRRPTQLGEFAFAWLVQKMDGGNGEHIWVHPGPSLMRNHGKLSLNSNGPIKHPQNEQMIVCYFPEVSFIPIQLDTRIHVSNSLWVDIISRYLMVWWLQKKCDFPLWKAIHMFKVSQSFYPAMCQPSSIY